jgi:hypothetical protein
MGFGRGSARDLDVGRLAGNGVPLGITLGQPLSVTLGGSLPIAGGGLVAASVIGGVWLIRHKR